MKKVFEIPSVHDYNAAFGIETLHPLVSVIDFSKARPPQSRGDVEHFSFGFYAVFLKQGQQCIMKYGRNNYDCQDGTLVFIAPGQVLTIEMTDKNYPLHGHGLLFHPDLILGTPWDEASRNMLSFLTTFTRPCTSPSGKGKSCWTVFPKSSMN